MAKTRKFSEIRDDKNAARNGSSSNGVSQRFPPCLDDDIAQLTRLRTEPHKSFTKVAPGCSKLPVSVAKMVAGRETNCSGKGRFSLADGCHVVSRYVPKNGPYKVDRMGSCAYVSQFSTDGSLLVAGFQSSHIKLYNVECGWKVIKNILAKSMRWTVTDTSLSPDRRFLVYSSMSPIVSIVNVESAETESHANITELHDGLDLSVDVDDDFGIFSVKFSTDGRELVASSNDDSIYVYDLEGNKVSHRISAHESDVNTVCFADKSGHILYSGSDDKLCKVWDRRCFAARGPAGILMGHLQGITFIDSKGDGRYFISNGKDQTLKLWDIRKMSPHGASIPVLRELNWDYRWMDYPHLIAKNWKHPSDQSLATYRGHSVLHTLIRCYFSPEFSTGQKYIYTGSSDGVVHVYDLLSGATVAKLDYHEADVRDCSWHPFYPMIVSSSWDCNVVRWEFPGEENATKVKRLKRSRRRPYRV
ncbi:WD40 repeat [Dillenia turbinata]|uniref:WD40 repeat n=1 Tax=Dillenia turbinata TaxID=194707 RepID=A0AAN8VMH8_9MAGN